MTDEQKKVEPGWYEYDGRNRYWNGERWTDHYDAPEPAPAATSQGSNGISFFGRALATWIGVVLGWGTIWLGAQADPDTFYWPIKTVIDESDQAELDAVQQQLEQQLGVPPN